MAASRGHKEKASPSPEVASGDSWACSAELLILVKCEGLELTTKSSQERRTHNTHMKAYIFASVLTPGTTALYPGLCDLGVMFLLKLCVEVSLPRPWYQDVGSLGSD